MGLFDSNKLMDEIIQFKELNGQLSAKPDRMELTISQQNLILGQQIPKRPGFIGQ